MVVYPSLMPVSNRALQVLADALRQRVGPPRRPHRRADPGGVAAVVFDAGATPLAGRQ